MTPRSWVLLPFCDGEKSLHLPLIHLPLICPLSMLQSSLRGFPNDGGASSADSRQSSATSTEPSEALDLEVTATRSLGPHSAAEAAIAARRAVVAEYDAAKQRAAQAANVMEPLAGHKRYRKLKNLEQCALAGLHA